MRLQFKASFERDLKRVKDKSLLKQVLQVIEEMEGAETISNVGNLRKLHADGPYFRVRLGDYRMGLIVEADSITFVRFLHRKEIYRYFP